MSLLFVGTLNVNNSHSLQEVKGGVQRIIANLSRRAVGVVECIFLSFLTWLTIPNLLMAIN